MFIVGILLMFGIVILIHEFGHFWVAKRLGMKVERFSLGFGPKIFSWKRNDTEYLLCALPFGGYVKLAGEDNVESTAPDEYSGRPAGQRALVLVSGALHNLLGAFLLLIPAFMLGVSTYDGTKIGELLKGYPAEVAGVQAGDQVLSINGRKCGEWLDVVMLLNTESNANPGKPLLLEINRQSEKMVFSIKPQVDESLKNMFKVKKRYVIGILPKEIIARYGFFKALTSSGKTFAYMVRDVFRVLSMLFTGQLSVKTLSGPVGIARMSGEAIKLGVATFCFFVALINVNLGIVNLFPFFVLDGGHLAGLLGEKILRRKPGKKLLEYSQIFGVVCIIAFALYITYNDILQILAEKFKR